MGFNNDIEDLINALYRPSIFYIPTTLFPNISEKVKQEFLDYRVTNEVAILKVNGKTAYADKCIPTMELLGKSNCLENNLFQLHKFKDQLKKDSFDFIFENYLRNVSACEYVYDWLNDNIRKSYRKSN